MDVASICSNSYTLSLCFGKAEMILSAASLLRSSKTMYALPSAGQPVVWPLLDQFQSCLGERARLDGRWGGFHCVLDVRAVTSEAIFASVSCKKKKQSEKPRKGMSRPTKQRGLDSAKTSKWETRISSKVLLRTRIGALPTRSRNSSKLSNFRQSSTPRSASSLTSLPPLIFQLEIRLICAK